MTSNDKVKLTRIYRTDDYRVLTQLAEELRIKWNNEPNGHTDQFLYLKETIGREGKVQGLSEFLKEIEKLSQEK